MAYVMLRDGFPHGPFSTWRVPGDLWGIYLSSVSLVHGHLSSIYAATPGTVVGFAPVAALGNALHLEVGPNFAAFTAPTGWLLVGPFEILVASLPLFGADALLERWGAGQKRRYLIALVEAVVLTNLTIVWGHPEDAVAVGFVLLAAGALADRRWTGAAWLLGVGIAVQPLAILAVPALAAYALRVSVARDHTTAGFFARVFFPYLVLLAPAIVFDRSDAVTWLTKQPNYPAFNHVTPLTRFSTVIHGSLGGVTSGPGRLVGIVVATVASIVVCERNRGRLDVALWAVLVSFWLSLASESVLDSYYIWPVLALAILLGARRRTAVMAPVCALAIGADWFCNTHVANAWLWWGVLMGALVGLIVLCVPEGTRLRRAPAPVAVATSDPMAVAAMAEPPRPAETAGGVRPGARRP
jgi:hypothetical protein